MKNLLNIIEHFCVFIIYFYFLSTFIIYHLICGRGCKQFWLTLSGPWEKSQSEDQSSRQFPPPCCNQCIVAHIWNSVNVNMWILCSQKIFFTHNLKLPEKIVADEVLGDFDNVVDVESGSACWSAFRTIVLGHPQYSDHIVTRSVNISD